MKHCKSIKKKIFKTLRCTEISFFSFSRCPQWPGQFGTSGAEARNHKPWKQSLQAGPNYCGYDCGFPRVCVGWKREPGAGTGNWTEAFWSGTMVSYLPDVCLLKKHSKTGCMSSWSNQQTKGMSLSTSLQRGGNFISMLENLIAKDTNVQKEIHYHLI